MISALISGKEYGLQELLEFAYIRQEENKKLIELYGFLPFTPFVVSPSFIADLWDFSNRSPFYGKSISDLIGSRKSCPIENIGRLFGTVGDCKLEGFIISPDYCIVRPSGECERHSERELL